MKDRQKTLKTSGLIFSIAGAIFTTLGLIANGIFLWLGIAFLLTGIAELAISRRRARSLKTPPNAGED